MFYFYLYSLRLLLSSSWPIIVVATATFVLILLSSPRIRIILTILRSSFIINVIKRYSSLSGVYIYL